MDGERLLQLEKASIDMMSPPHSVTEERRKQAEAMFMELRNSKLPYSTCKYILENSQSDFVLFQSASTIREAVIREWLLLPVEEKTELRCYLLQYLTSHPSLTPYVRAQILHTVAVLVKRATLEVDCKQLFGSVLDSVAQMLASGDVRMRHLGCSLLSALVTEYANSSGSSSIGLPLEFHLQCKKAIQKEQLLHVLHLATQVLQQFLPLECHTLPKEDHTLLTSFLQLVAQLLNWDFQQQQKMFKASTEVVNISLRPPKSYAQTFLDPSFLRLFFQLLSKLRLREDDVHHVIQCLTQLSSLTKPALTTDHEQQQYLTNFVGGVLEYVRSSSELSQQEMYGLSCVLRRLSTNFSIEQFGQMGTVQLQALIQLLTQLTCLCAQKTAQEEEEEKASYRESLEHYLEVCVTFLTFWDSNNPSLPPKSSLIQPMVDIFNAYTQSKLSAPRGWRTTPPQDDEILDLEEDDRVMFADELSSVGCIARAIASHSLPLLVTLLGQSMSECLQLLVLIQHNPMVLSSNQNRLESIYEDLHWLGLVAGYTLCDVAHGEVVQIPKELMKYSISCHKSSQQQQQEQGSGRAGADFERNIAALILEGGGSQEGGGIDLLSLDPVVALVMSVCRLSLLEKQFISCGLMDLLSPQLCETGVWCLSKITEPYVMFSDENYQQVSLPLVAAFGKESESGRWLAAFLVEKVAFNLSAWSSEETLCSTSIQLLQSLVKSLPRAYVCIQCEVLWTLMHSFSSGSSTILALPPRAQKQLMGSLVMCAMGEKKKEFLAQLLQPFQTRFTTLVQAGEFPSQCHQLDTKWALLAVLEPMCGLAACVRIAYIQEFFSFLLPILETCVSLLELYTGTADVVAVILELFILVAENYTVFLDQANTTKLYEVCLSIIQTYAKYNSGKYSKSSLAEEEQCEDLLLFLKLLSHLTTKDYLNFAPDDDSVVDSVVVEPVDVVVMGISTVLPLMSEETLKFPKLCLQFFTLLHYMCQDFPKRVLALPNKMILSFMKLLEMGLTNFTQDICIDSLECVEALALCYGSNPPQPDHSHTLFTQSFQHFLKVIFEIILSSTFDMDLIGPASASIFILICIQQDYYTSLAEALVNSLSCEPHNHARLVQAFQQLTPPSLTLDLSRNSKQTFRKNLEQFLPFVKGFLFYR